MQQLAGEGDPAGACVCSPAVGAAPGGGDWALEALGLPEHPWGEEEMGSRKSGGGEKPRD